MSGLLCLLLALLAVASQGQAANADGFHANRSKAVEEVNARDDLYTKGSATQDVKLLSSLWADSFIDTNGTGKVRNKAQMLSIIAEGKAKGAHILGITVSDRRTQAYGDAAVVTGMFTARSLEGGKPQVEKGRFTDVWIKQAGTWLCVAAHSSPIKP